MSQLIIYLLIALLALTANIFGSTVGSGVTSMLPNGVVSMIIAGFVISLILLLFSITGFIFSVIQISIIQKKRKRVRDASRSPHR